MLDLRPATAFAAAFIPGSVSLPDFHAPELLAKTGLADRRLYLLAEGAEPVERAAEFFKDSDSIAGWFRPEIIEWWKEIQGRTAWFEAIRPDTLAVRVAAWKTTVLDVRGEEAFRRMHISDAIRVPIDGITGALEGLPLTTSLSLICESGMQCSFAGSLLWNAGYRNIAIVDGGFQAYLEQRLPVVPVREDRAIGRDSYSTR